MISIHTLKNQIEAQVIENALQEAGIKCIIRTFEDRAYNGIFIPQNGYGQVLVEEKDRERAKEIIYNWSK
jgi:signal recognition particle subunit SEC65